MDKTHKKIKLGWIGAGFVGQVAHLERFVKFKSSKVVALAEMRPKLCSNVAKAYGIPKTYNHHHDLIEKGECDAIVAITHRRNTFEIARDVLEAGIHLLTEKPMAMTSTDANTLVDIAKKKGLIYGIGYMRRFDNGVRQAKTIIEDLRKTGEFGSITSIRIFLEAGKDYCGISQRVEPDEVLQNPPPPVAPDWIPKVFHSDYDNFVNECCHDINLLRFLFPDDFEVTTVNFKPKAISHATLDYGDFFGILEWGFLPKDVDEWREGMEIRFERGQLLLQLPLAFLRNVPAKVVLRCDRSSTSKEAYEKTINGDRSWAFENSDSHFVNSIIKGVQPENSGEDSLNDHDIIDQIWHIIVEKNKNSALTQR